MVVKSCVVLGHEFIYTEVRKEEFQKSGLEKLVVLNDEFSYREV